MRHSLSGMFSGQQQWFSFVELDGQSVRSAQWQAGEEPEPETTKFPSVGQAVNGYFDRLSKHRGHGYSLDRAFEGITPEALSSLIQLAGETGGSEQSLERLDEGMLIVAPKDAGVFLRRYRKLAQARKEMRGDMNPRPLLDLAERLEAITQDADADQSDAGPVRRQAKALMAYRRAARISDECRLADYDQALELLDYASKHLAVVDRDGWLDQLPAAIRNEHALWQAMQTHPPADRAQALFIALSANDVPTAKVLVGMGATLEPRRYAAQWLTHELRPLIAAGEQLGFAACLAHVEELREQLRVLQNRFSGFSGFTGNKIFWLGRGSAVLQGAFEPAEVALQRAIQQAEERAIATLTSQPDAALEQALCEHFVSYESALKYEGLARLGSAKAFERTLADATRNCHEDESVGIAPLYALVRFARQEPYRAAARDFLCREVFRLLVEERGEDDLINQVMFAAACNALARLGEPALGPLLAQQFMVAADEKQHYAMNKVTGDVAIGLAALDHNGAAQAMADFLESYEWRYPGEDFVVKVRYAQWLLSGDAAGAVAYFDDAKNVKSLGLVAAAIADLHALDAQPVLERRLPGIKDPVAREAVLEAIARLRQQSGKPAPAARMIHLFGVVTTSEQLVGVESDNEFGRRAQRRGAEPAQVTEEGDATPVDR